MQGDAGRCSGWPSLPRRGAGRCKEMQGDARRCREMQGDVAGGPACREGLSEGEPLHHLPISPYISLHLPTSPSISPVARV